MRKFIGLFVAFTILSGCNVKDSINEKDPLLPNMGNQKPMPSSDSQDTPSDPDEKQLREGKHGGAPTLNPYSDNDPQTSSSPNPESILDGVLSPEPSQDTKEEEEKEVEKEVEGDTEGNNG